jgi:hypothetical protein
MKIKAVLFLALMTFISCQPVLLKLYGIKDPDIEHEKTILRKAFKFNLDTSNIVPVNSKDFLSVLRKNGIPEGAIYDSKGKYIEYRQTDTSCNAGLFQFIPALKLNGQYNQPDSSDLTTELNKFRDLKGNPLKKPEPADYYLLIYWTIWTGKLNKDHVKIWEEQARNNQQCKIKVIKVNLDIQENWEIQERTKIINAMSKKKK